MNGKRELIEDAQVVKEGKGGGGGCLPSGLEGRGNMSREMSSWSATLSDEVMAAARRAFERHDHDNSGTIQVEVSASQCGGTRARASRPCTCDSEPANACLLSAAGDL